MALVKEAIDYLVDVAGLQVAARRIRPKNLPVFITDHYDFHLLALGNEDFLGVEVKGDFSPSALKKHQTYFPTLDVDHRSFVLIAPRLEGFIRKRLLAMRVPFIVPNVQLYWPALGVEFRKHNQRRVYRNVDAFNPATQAVVIAVLNDIFSPTFLPKHLAKRLGYTRMSMTRALDEMENAGLGRSARKGRDRIFTPLGKSDLWQKSLPFLINPVRVTMRLAERDMLRESKLLAGENALARISMLAEPQILTYAVGRDQGKRLQDKAIPNLNTDEPDTCIVQIWRYDPALFAKGGTVDAFSLYLSLKDSTDDRVAIASTQMIKETLDDKRLG